VILVPAAAVLSRRHLWVLLNAGAVTAGPIMGFFVPSRLGAARDDGIITLRILTCNGGGSGLRGEDLIALVEEVRPDIIVLQERRRMPSHPDFWRDWQIQGRGGVCLASRFPIRDVASLEGKALGGDGMAVRYVLATPAGDIDFFGLHLETVREGLEAVIYGKWRGIPDLRANIALRTAESEAASRWVAQSRRPVLVAGDFNLPVDSVIYQKSWSWLTNAFSQAGMGFGYSKFTRWHGVRIDHVLGGPGWRCRRCWVAPDIGSDHRPVIAEMVLDRQA
jgi:vancomycin resistance protein VanJ